MPHADETVLTTTTVAPDFQKTSKLASADPLVLAAQQPPSFNSYLEFFDAAAPRYDNEKPYFIHGPLDEQDEAMRTNITYRPRDDIPVYDVRGLEDRLSLEEHNVMVKSRPPLGLTFESKSDEVEKALTNTTQWLKEQLNAEFVACYDYTLRMNSDLPNREQDGAASDAAPTRYGKPAKAPHIDQTYGGGLNRVARHMTEEEVQKYINNPNYRVRIINYWHAITSPVRDAPLAFVDWRTLSLPNDTVPCDRVFSAEYVGEVYYVRYNPNHKWYWLKDMTDEEAFVFVSYDNTFGDVMRDGEVVDGVKIRGRPGLPHGAFSVPGVVEKVKRQSLEVRAIVVDKIA